MACYSSSGSFPILGRFLEAQSRACCCNLHWFWKSPSPLQHAYFCTNYCLQCSSTVAYPLKCMASLRHLTPTAKDSWTWTCTVYSFITSVYLMQDPFYPAPPIKTSSNIFICVLNSQALFSTCVMNNHSCILSICWFYRLLSSMLLEDNHLPHDHCLHVNTDPCQGWGFCGFAKNPVLKVL